MSNKLTEIIERMRDYAPSLRGVGMTASDARYNRTLQDADYLESLAQQLAAKEPRLLHTSDDHAVCVGGRFDGWLMWKHPDGQWVSVEKLRDAAIAKTEAR